MKIALIAHNSHPVTEPYAGGLEMIVHLLTKRLKQRNYEVDLYAPPGSDEELNYIPIQAKTNFASFREKESEEHLAELQSLDGYLSYKNAFQQIAAGEYDLVHNHSMHHYPLLYANNCGVPTLTTLHVPPLPSVKMTLLNKEKYSQHHYSVVSKSLGSQYSGIIPDSTVVYNGIDTSNWQMSYRANPEQVIWFGRICKEKAPHQAIEASLRAGKVIVLAGPVSEPAYFKKKILPYIENPLVKYAGHLTHKELNEELMKSCASLFTSVWNEPYGLAIAESLACGTPVISWNKGAAPEILTKDCGALIEPNRIDEMADSIQSLPEKISREDCRKRAVDFCDVDNMVHSYENVYHQIVNASKNIMV